MNDLPWWAKPAGSTADVNRELHNMPVESGSVFPLTTYADNTTRFNPQAGVLGSLINAFTAPSRAYNGQIPPNQMVPEGMNMAGAIALGSLPFGRPGSSLGMGARPKGPGRDMSGYSDVMYHGTSADPKTGQIFRAFDPQKSGATTGNRSAQEQGVWLANSPELADQFALLSSDRRGGAPATMPLRYRSEKQGRLHLDDNTMGHEVSATLANAWDNGFDSVVVENYNNMKGYPNQTVVVVKDPAQIRSSTAAKFDPKNRSKNDLLASNPSTAALLGLLNINANNNR